MRVLDVLRRRPASVPRFARVVERDGGPCFVATLPALNLADGTRVPGRTLFPPLPPVAMRHDEAAALAPGVHADLAHPWIDRVVVRRADDGTDLREGVDYTVDLVQGRLLGLGAAAVRVDYDWAPHRYDCVALDPLTGQVLVLPGPHRERDVNECIPRTPAGLVTLFYVFVGRRFCEVVPVHDWDGPVRRGREAAHAAWAEDTRARLPRTLARLRAGLPLTLASYGDSNGALGPSRDRAAPDGARDRVAFWARYPAETLAGLDRMPDDPEGMRDGWNWRLVRGLEARFGAPCAYRNWCIAGTAIGAERHPDRPPGGLDPDRLGPFLAAEWDLALVQFGTNSIDPETFGHGYNRDGTRALIAAIVAAGREVLVLGPPRPCPVPARRLTGWWRDANRAIIAGAHDAGAAHVDFSHICGPGEEGGLGLSPTTLCEQNQYNHPGLYEHRAYAGYILEAFTA